MIRKLFSVCMIILIAFGVKSQKPEMILVEGGTFSMGNDFLMTAQDESPERKVILNDFYIGKYEVTFEEFDLFCLVVGYPLPDDGGYGRGKLPVANLSWQSAVMYCNWLSARDGYDRYYTIQRDSTNYFRVTMNNTANGYRLPTEAEWEYAARGGKKGTTTSYSGSNNVDTVAWYKGNSKLKPQIIGTKAPNALGIHDMSGNVWEWCWDFYDKNYYQTSKTANPEGQSNPTGPVKGTERVFRGGNWNSTLDFLRLTSRYPSIPNKETGMVGMRLARNK